MPARRLSIESENIPLILAIKSSTVAKHGIGWRNCKFISIASTRKEKILKRRFLLFINVCCFPFKVAVCTASENLVKALRSLNGKNNTGTYISEKK